MSIPAKQCNLYANILVLDMDGNPLFRTSHKKAKWYLKKDLVDIIEDHGDRLVLQLRFKAGGLGDSLDPYLMSRKENRCVICGTTEDLTSHHIMPYCYRKHFPIEMKEHSHYDVMPVCVKHHQEYETDALKLKILLEAEYANIAEPQIQKHSCKISGYAKTLLKFGNQLPEIRKADMLWAIYEEFGHTDLENIAKNSIAPLGKGERSKEVVENYGDLYDFVLMWRKHFIDTMNPQFISKEWDINKKYW